MRCEPVPSYDFLHCGDSPASNLKWELINPKRSFMGEISLTKLNKKRQLEKPIHLFLFNDCLLICKPHKDAAKKVQQAKACKIATTHSTK